MAILRSRLLIAVLLPIVGMGCVQQQPIVSAFDSPGQEIDNQIGLRQVIQQGHSSEIDILGFASAVFSPDGKQILSWGIDDTLKLWDVATGQEIRSFRMYSASRVIESGAFSPDGKQIISGTENVIKLLDVATGQEIRTFRGHSENVLSVAFSPDGKHIVSGSRDKTLKLWDVAMGQEIRTFTGHSGRVNSVAFSPDGKRVLSVDNVDKTTTLEKTINAVRRRRTDSTLKLWDVATGQEIRTFRGHSEGVGSVAFSPDGKQILTRSVDKTLKLWDVATGQEIQTFREYPGVHYHSVAFSPDGKQIISGDENGIPKLWDVATGQVIRTFKGGYSNIIKGYNSNIIISIAFSPDGNQIISGSLNNTLKLWDVASGQEIRIFTGHSKPVTSVAFSPDGKQALVGSNDATLKLWDVTSGREIRIFTGHSYLAPSRVFSYILSSVTFSPDGKQILSGGADKTFKLWNAVTGQEIRTFKGHSEGVNSVAFSPDGKQILSGSDDKTLKLWNVVTGQEIRTFIDPYADPYKKASSYEGITSVAFSPDGKKALSWSLWGALFKLWDVETGKSILNSQTGTYTYPVFSPDGNQILSGGDDNTSFKLWDIATGREIQTFSGHSEASRSVVFSPDGKQLLSGSGDWTLKLWDVDTGQVIRTFRGHSDAVNSVAFSPDGKKALSGSMDGTARIWDVSSGQLLITMLASPDGEWSINTPDGYYDTSPEGKDLVHYASSSRTYSFEQFESLFHRPDIIRARLAGNLQAGTPAPPLSIPPTVKTVGSRSFTTVDSATYPLTVVASSPAGTVKSVRVFVNGKATNEQAVEAREKRLDLQIPLFAGPNHIAVLAYDDRGFSSRPESLNVISKASGRKPTLYAMGIGVATYPKLPKAFQLDYPASDAKHLVQALQAGKGKIFSDVKDLILTNQAATPEAIQKGLEALTAMDSNDIAVIFLAGHGTRDQTGKFWFVTSQGNLDHPEQGGLNWDILDAYIGKMRGRVILLLDACHSGSIVDTTVVPNDELAARFFKGQAGGVMVFSAAKGRQQSLESQQIGGGFGLFTYALTQGLGPAAREVDHENKGYVSFMDLVDYASKYVNAKTTGQQTPWLSRRELFGDLPIGTY